MSLTKMKMATKTTVLEKNACKIPDSHFGNLPCLYRPSNNGLRNWRSDPVFKRHRSSIRRRIADFLSVKTSYGMKQRALLMTSLERDLFMEAALKEEYISEETLNDRLQSLLHLKHNAAARHGKRVNATTLELPSISGVATPTSGQPGQPLVHNRLDGNDGCILSLRINEPVYELGCKGKHQPDLQTSSGCSKFTQFKDSAEVNFNKSEDLLPCPKRMKRKNSCVVAPPLNQTTCPQSPLSINAKPMEEQFGESFTLSTQYSMSLSEIRYNDAHEFIKPATVPYEEIVDEPVDLEMTLGNNTGDNAKKISDALLFKSSCVSPKELEVDCEAAELQMRAVPIQTQPELEADYHGKETKSGSPRIKDVSIIEILTTKQIKEHISSLRQWTDQDFSEKCRPPDKNACQLCGKGQILLAPEQIFCSCCNALIKHNVNYYYCLPKEDSQQYYFCTKCYKLSKGGTISIPEMCIHISKETLCQGKNDSEIEESWVQCDKCEGWQHQICGLFSDKINSGGDSEYKCPICWLKEKESQEKESERYKPSISNAVFSAKDLPRTKLSDHIEERLFRHLEQERRERAKAAGKCFDEVPIAEDLTVRVALSIKKKLIVKKQLLDTLEDESYPTEFPYTLKLILLFQKIGGIDLCLFSVYVQEFGSECSQPNKRRVYISYLDSIKYFRPAIGTSTKEALRTFVFHEILIGYLDYIKKRGFATCHIWSCPPSKGDDFFFHCHPEAQKIPKPDKLQKWYHSMLRKAEDEEIVVNYTNLYDHLFMTTGEAKCKITAACVPYFDGDYWSGSIENAVKVIEEENKENPKNKMKKTTKTSLRVMGQTNSSNVATKDTLLMEKLRESILPCKKNFMFIHLQFVCTCCGEPILSGKRWFCNQCRNFNLCEICHDMEQDLYLNDMHTSVIGVQHLLSQVFMDVTLETKDVDIILDNELFENRNNFLSFCRDNHYQFDSLRRAKHSSMIMLHHLHRLAAPAVEPGSCHINNSTSQQPSAVCQGERSEAELPERLRMKLLELLQHANHCRATKADPCDNKHCNDMKTMFSHAKMCTVRVNGGCTTCGKVWYALKLHAKDCTEEDCLVPRCKDLKRFSA